MEISKERKFEGKEVSNFGIKVSHEEKLRQLLRNITSAELKLCIDSCREFIKILKGDEGGNFLREYIKTSSLCTEFVQAWNHWQGKPGLSYILSLISSILRHPDGMYKPNDMGVLSTSRALDKFAKLIIEERLNDLCKELSSKEVKCQHAALLLLASIVRRGSGLASDVAKSFDFKLPGFSKLAEFKNRKFDMKRKHSTRRSFVGFAMSFLEAGKPGLLRWVLQQREIFSGVLRGLGNDDDETVVYVLSTLQDRVLTPESLVPPPLRSVLFGSVTLDQLIQISGRKDGGFASELAAEILNMVCTDPSNGLMPDVNRKPNPLKGNLTRLLGVMKKLKAIEIEYHRDLLLAIVHGRPQFAAAYLDEFPFNLEDHASTNWFAAISLAANVISSVTAGSPFGFIDSQALGPPSINSPDLQNILKCVGPRPFTRAVMNKGLLHSQSLVKHGTLRLVLETLKLLDSLFCAINSNSDPNNQITSRWVSLQHEIQDEVRLLLPDPQVLLKLLSSLNKCAEPCLKRAADIEVLVKQNRRSSKKLKTSNLNEDRDVLVCGISSPPDDAKKLRNQDSNEDLDILVGGINALTDAVFPDDSGRVLEEDNLNEQDNLNNPAKDIAELWGICQSTSSLITPEDEETYFFSKLLDTLCIYHRAMPSLVQGSSDFFKLLPSNALALPSILQESLLSLLIEHIGCSSNRVDPTRILPQIYKNLNSFINLLIYSLSKDIKDKAYVLAQAAMLSTGAFDNNPREIDTWFSFLPGYGRDGLTPEDKAVEIIRKQFSIVVSFLCDAVSTTGNNLFKYWDNLMRQIYDSGSGKDISPDFSPLFLCVLEKCVRLLGSESGNFSVPEKSLISLYVSNTLMYFLQTQVNAGLLASLINVLHERLKVHFSSVDSSEDLCEWRPLKSLFRFSRSITDQQICNTSSIDSTIVHADSSFIDTLDEVNKVLEGGQDCELAGLTSAFSLSLLCAKPSSIVHHFPSVISISQRLPSTPVSIISSIFFLEKNLFNCALKLWPEDSLSALERVITVIDNDGEVNLMEPAFMAFYTFLKQAPFHVLFPAFISIDCPYLSHSSKLQALLSFKLSEGMDDRFSSSLHLILFWFHDVQLSYRTKPVYELEQLSEICFNLFDVVLSQPSSVHHAQEMAEIIFSHPAITTSFECPLSVSKELNDDIFGKTSEDFLALIREGIHKMDYHVLSILTKSLNHLFIDRVDNKSICVIDTENHTIQKPLKSLMQKLLLIVRERFDKCISLKKFAPLIPSLYPLHTLIRFICPFELLELVYWIFSRDSLNDPNFPVSSKIMSLSIGLGISACAFDLLSCFQDPRSVKLSFDFRGSEEKNSSMALLEKVYFLVVDIATKFELPIADHCMLQAVKIVNAHKFLRKQCLPLCMVMSKLVSKTPLKILSHCMRKLTLTKAQLLFHISDVSQLHQSVFGYLFTEMANQKGNMIQGCNHDLSDDDFTMLLPTVTSYLNSNLRNFGNQFYEHLRAVPFLFWNILVSGLSNWKSYVSRDVFQVKLDDYFPSSLEKLLNVVHNSLLGKAIFMIHHYFAISGVSVEMKERLKLFNQIIPSGIDSLLDCGLNEIDSNSIEHSLNHVVRGVAKFYLCRMLITGDEYIHVKPKEVEDGDRDKKDIPPKSCIKARIKFVNTLVYTWQLIVKKFPSDTDVESRSSSLFRFLETFILRNIVELTKEVCFDTRSESYAFPWLEELAKSCLLYRFEDVSTLCMLQSVFTLVPDGTTFHSSVLQLLLSHSQFAPAIQSASELSASAQFGMIFRPMSSILRSLVFSSAHQKTISKTILLKPLEIVKLIRILIRSSGHRFSLDSGNDKGINSKELLFLLLSSYGASVSTIDLEIYNLMHEIESMVDLNYAIIKELDYLWGNAAKRIRREREVEKCLLSDDNNDEQGARERRRIQFRENFPIDPKICASTVLHFPYDRVHSSRSLSINKFHINNDVQMAAHDESADKTGVYDPFFILRFSIHSLSMGYFEPVEFASLGLLAIAVVSISSLDDEMRKLGYETLGRFKNALEISQKRKDIKQLRLLLEYVQNGINEPWQRIPSVCAVFVAEASFILLDRSHPHYSTIIGVLKGKFMDMKSIPLFHNFFWSTSSNYKLERLWMLRLLCAGLNLEDDAKIYRNNSILEILLSFYASPFSDHESRELILQILKKSVKLHETSHYLVKDCGLVAWLSSSISNFDGGSYQDQRSFPLTHLDVTLEVIDGVISSKHIIEWLQISGLVQLAELSSQLYRLLVVNFTEIKENVYLINSILEILTSTLKISQKRDGFRPQCTLSGEVLFQLYRVTDAGNGNSSPDSVLALKLILMSTPPAAIFSMDQEKFCQFIVWAVSTATHSFSMEALELEENNNNIEMLFEKEQSEESLLSKLLRWLTASVILAWWSRKSSCLESNCSLPKSNPKTLQDLFEDTKNVSPRTWDGLHSQELLAAAILYMQQLLGAKCSGLSSVVTALGLLLFSDSSFAGSEILLGQENFASLCSRIGCPPEAVPEWRWSSHLMWKDDPSEYSVVEKMDEFHACRGLLVVISNVLDRKSSNPQFLSYKDVENLGVFKWEKSLLES